MTRTKRIRKALLQIFKAHDIHLMSLGRGEDPGASRSFRRTWNGRELRDYELDNGELAHELGHWLVAAPSRRKRPEYGLNKLSIAYSDTEEELASILGIAVEFHINGDWKMTWREHYWDDEGVDGGVWRAVMRCMELERRGLMINGRPVALDKT